MVGFAAFGGSGGSSSTDAQAQGSSHYQFNSAFKNTAKQLTISLEYGLMTIRRPWLVSDLFYMGNWYLVGNRKNCVSDGTEKNQANLTDINKLPLLPMIPQQMLVIRNVVISAKEWGSDGEVLQNSFGGFQDSSSSSSSSEAGTAGVCLGFISFGGSAGHEETHAKGQGSSWSASGATGHYGATFDGSTLKIPGAQIIAFLSDIVPATPPLDDPSLPQPAAAKKTSTVSAATLQPANV